MSFSMLALSTDHSRSLCIIRFRQYYQLIYINCDLYSILQLIVLHEDIPHHILVVRAIVDWSDNLSLTQGIFFQTASRYPFRRQEQLDILFTNCCFNMDITACENSASPSFILLPYTLNSRLFLICHDIWEKNEPFLNYSC